MAKITAVYADPNKIKERIEYVTTRETDLYAFWETWAGTSYRKSRTVPKGTTLVLTSKRDSDQEPVWGTNMGYVKGRVDIASLKEKPTTSPGIISASFFKQHEQTIYGIGIALFLLFFFKVGEPTK
jgi:hypothetical protein